MLYTQISFHKRAWIAVVAVLTAASAARADFVENSQTYSVSIDTASLAADAADQPFALAVQFNSGGTTGVQNTATLSGFNFSGGSAGDAASIFTSGDVTGSFAGTVSLDTNGGAFSYFQQDFHPGTAITFNMTTTRDEVDPTIDTPDMFSIQLLDAAGIALPTTDPSTADSVLTITYDRPIDIQAFSSDSSRTTTAGETISFAAPTITAVPEPSSVVVAFAGMVVASSLLRRRRSRYASAANQNQ